MVEVDAPKREKVRNRCISCGEEIEPVDDRGPAKRCFDCEEGHTLRMIRLSHWIAIPAAVVLVIVLTSFFRASVLATLLRLVR